MAEPGSADTEGVLARLAATIAARRGTDPAASYVAALLAKGDDAILKKIGEEATETVMAAKDGDPRRIAAEVADLWFHCLVLLANHGLSPADVLAGACPARRHLGPCRKGGARPLSVPAGDPRPISGPEERYNGGKRGSPRVR